MLMMANLAGAVPEPPQTIFRVCGSQASDGIRSPHDADDDDGGKGSFRTRHIASHPFPCPARIIVRDSHYSSSPDFSHPLHSLLLCLEYWD